LNLFIIWLLVLLKPLFTKLMETFLQLAALAVALLRALKLTTRYVILVMLPQYSISIWFLSLVVNLFFTVYQ